MTNHLKIIEDALNEWAGRESYDSKGVKYRNCCDQQYDRTDLESLLEQAASRAVLKVIRPKLDINDMMERYNCKSRATIHRWVDQGQLPAPVNGMWSREKLDALDGKGRQNA